MTDLTQSEAWQRGQQAAKDQMASFEPAKAKVADEFCGLHVSILASPCLLEWPREVREWIFQRCTRPGRGPGEHDRHAWSREALGLAEAPPKPPSRRKRR